MPLIIIAFVDGRSVMLNHIATENVVDELNWSIQQYRISEPLSFARV